MKSCIAHTVHNQQGNAELGYIMSRDGITLAEESGDIISKAEAYVHNGVACYLKGYFDEAKLNLTKGTEFSDRLNLTYSMTSGYYLGLIELEGNNYGLAIDHFTKSISTMKNRGIFTDFQKLVEIG